jgi:transcription-repair coupling factor (superfamily II helicase)
LDIPNANTIIIDRADRFGLSDLYQLRGRVGRYKHQAYAYLLLPRHAGLLAEARKRLSAIKQYSTLGSGFRIAMRDLEIRGAGNLLGAEQSGHIAAVGFELYCSLLQQSVKNLKGEKTKPRFEVQMRLDFLIQPHETRAKTKEDPLFTTPAKTHADIQVPREVGTYVADSPAPRESGHAKPAIFPKAAASLPVSYITQAQHRIEIHRKLAQAVDAATLGQLRIELRDRFGPLPPSAELLLKVAELKLIAVERNISIVETKGEKLMLTRNHDYIMVGGKFPRLKRTTPSARLNEIKRMLLWI